MVKDYLLIIEKYDSGTEGLNSIREINPNAINEEKIAFEECCALNGLAIVVKDNIDVKGLHTTAGSLALSDNIALEDAEVIANLKSSGAVILGKANMTEFANYMTNQMPGGYSSMGGQVISAYNRKENPWGSSTGSAVAVSAGMCHAAVGTDSCGSIVLAAMRNGVCGYRPPAGELRQKGIIPISFTMDTAGPIARNVAALISLYNGMKGKNNIVLEDTSLAGKKIAVNQWGTNIMSKSDKEHMETVIKRLKKAGAVLENIELKININVRTIMLYEFRYGLDKYLQKANSKIRSMEGIVVFNEKHAYETLLYGEENLLFALRETSGRMDESIYREAMKDRQDVVVAIKEKLKKYDACYMCMPKNNISQYAGLPSISLPDGLGEDYMPLGIFLCGADENRLLDTAYAMEKTICKGYIKPDIVCDNVTL
jgi:amidase